ncbi:sugar phosphate nucleotidyltransferase [Caldiplasma sukawensis]
MEIKGILMAGGKGTRLRPLTYSIPKPIIPVAGRPCIDYAINSFKSAGIEDIIVTTGYKFESLIKGIMENDLGSKSILYSVEKEPMGTAGGIKLVENFIDSTMMVGSGDVLTDFNLNEALEFHRDNSNLITIILTEVDDPTQFGIVETDGKYVKKFLEKPSKDQIFSRSINAGIYIMEPEIFRYIPKGVPYDFAKDLFPKLLSEGIKIGAIKLKGTWLDAGRPHDLIKGTQLMIAKYGREYNLKYLSGTAIIKEEPMGKNFRLQGNCYLGQNVKFGDGVIVENSAIYSNVRILDNSRISNSIIFENCVIENDSTIEGSLLMRGIRIGSKTEIHDSALASGINIQGGSKIFNVSLSSENSENE